MLTLKSILPCSLEGLFCHAHFKVYFAMLTVKSILLCSLYAIFPVLRYSSLFVVALAYVCFYRLFVFMSLKRYHFYYLFSEGRDFWWPQTNRLT